MVQNGNLSLRRNQTDYSWGFLASRNSQISKFQVHDVCSHITHTQRKFNTNNAEGPSQFFEYIPGVNPNLSILNDHKISESLILIITTKTE